MTEFAKRFKELRLRKNETQDDLAEEFKVTRGMISHWETGKYYPEAVKLIEIADYFEVSIDYLLGRTTNKNVNITNSFNNSNNSGNFNF